MSNVLVTGGAGHLGHHAVTNLVEMGYTARIMSRRPQPAHLLPGTQWAQADLTTGQGLPEAVADIDVIVHTASDPGHAQHIDVDGTRLLLEKARAAGVAHVICISIVGVERIPYRYYQYKLATEEIIEHAGIPWSVLRATQFHGFVDYLLQGMTKFPLIAFVPTDFKAQTIDESEVARRLCEVVATGPGGRLPDLGGPEVLTLGAMAKMWLKQRKMQRTMLPLWLPGAVARGFRSGYNTCPQESLHGNITWSAWLQKRYHIERKATEEDAAAHERQDDASTL